MRLIVNVVDFEMNLAEAVDSPRIHHQWLPDSVSLENGFPLETLEELRALGYLQSHTGSYTTIRQRERPPTTLRPYPPGGKLRRYSVVGFAD